MHFGCLAWPFLRCVLLEKAINEEAVNEALAAGWRGQKIAERFPLEEIAMAHERVEAPQRRWRIVQVL